jgi:sulfur-oxidizing protein SoxY
MRHGESPLRATRRRVLAVGGLGGVVAALAPRLVMAKPADVAAILKKLYGDKAIAPGKVKLDMPQIAENGAVVPVTISVDSPMTDADHVKAVHLLSEGNPLPEIATFHFTPACGKAVCSTRIRMARTQFIVAVAETSTGALHSGKTEVKVTIGGCGG